MLDVHLFMGWTPKNAMPQNEEYNPTDIYYGQLPANAISVFDEFVRNAVKNHADLVAIFVMVKPCQVLLCYSVRHITVESLEHLLAYYFFSSLKQIHICGLK